MTRVLAFAAVTALVAAGCGGGGGKQLTKAQLVSQADAICKDFNAKLTAAGTPNSLQGLKTFADTLVPVAQDGNNKLRKLKPPKDIESAYTSWLDQSDKVVAIVKRLGDAANKGDVATVRNLGTEFARENAKAKQLATQVGLTSCAQ